MRKMLLAFVAIGAVAAAVATPAEAEGGCGVYRHRAPGGRCYSNAYGARPGLGIVTPGVVIAPGYGYGYGWRHRYYRHY